MHLTIFSIDLVYVTVGYVLTMRLLDAYVRSTEPTMEGWVVAIMCYQPF